MFARHWNSLLGLSIVLFVDLVCSVFVCFGDKKGDGRGVWTVHNFDPSYSSVAYGIVDKIHPLPPFDIDVF